MSAAELLLDLDRLGIRLAADGKRLRYYPRSAVTPDLAKRMQANKGELLTLVASMAVGAERQYVDHVTDPLGPWIERPHATGRWGWESTSLSESDRWWAPATPDLASALLLAPTNVVANPGTPICGCGSTTWHDVQIHDGQSLRRDCGRCGRFVEFLVWYEENTGQ